LNPCVPGVELEDHIETPIAIDILKGRVYRRRLCTDGPEADGTRVYSGGIKGVRRQDGDRGHPLAPRVDARWAFAGFDVDVHGDDIGRTKGVERSSRNLRISRSNIQRPHGSDDRGGNNNIICDPNPFRRPVRIGLARVKNRPSSREGGSFQRLSLYGSILLRSACLRLRTGLRLSGVYFEQSALVVYLGATEHFVIALK
jgi:hypothetical protein